MRKPDSRDRLQEQLFQALRDGFSAAARRYHARSCAIDKLHSQRAKERRQRAERP